MKRFGLFKIGLEDHDMGIGKMVNFGQLEDHDVGIGKMVNVGQLS